MEGKGQIFFFGRPGCLKQSIPIRVNEEEEEAEKKNDDSVELGDKNETQKPIQTSDDDTDGDELMKRISEVLEDDEPGISQNHNDKSNDLKSTENCEKDSPVNNNDHKENNDNTLSALETLSENNESVVKLNECSSENSEAIISNATEKCGEEKIITNNDESTDESCQERRDENLVKSDDKIEDKEKIVSNEDQTPKGSVPKDTEVVSSVSNEIVQSHAVEENKRSDSETVDSSVDEISGVSEKESIELPQKSEKINVSEDYEKSEKIQTLNEIEEESEKTEAKSELILPSSEISEKFEQASTSEVQESEVESAEVLAPFEINEKSEDASTPVSENDEKLLEEVNSEETFEAPKPLQKPESPKDTPNNESQIISDELPTQSSEVQEISQKVEEEPCLPETCDTESNQLDEEDVNTSDLPQSSTMTQLRTEEIEPKPETINTSENTQNIPSEPTSITEVLDSNKIEETNEEILENLCESSKVETFEPEIKDDLESINELESVEDSKPPNENVLNDETLQLSSENIERSEVLEEYNKNEAKNEKAFEFCSHENSSNEAPTNDIKLVMYDESSSEDATVPSLDDNKSQIESTNDEKLTSESIETPMDISREKIHEKFEETEIENKSNVPEPQTSTNFIKESSSELNEEQIKDYSTKIIEEKSENSVQEIQTITSDKVKVQENLSDSQELEISPPEPEEQKVLHSELPKETEEPQEILGQSDKDLGQPENEDDNASITSIEEHKGIEISEPKSEDISIAEEALPKDEISVPQRISQPTAENVPEASISHDMPTEIENEILPQELNTKTSEKLAINVDEILPNNEKLEKSPEVNIEEEKVSNKVELASKAEELSQTEEIDSESDAPADIEENYSDEEKLDEPVENVSENLEPQEILLNDKNGEPVEATPQNSDESVSSVTREEPSKILSDSSSLEKRHEVNIEEEKAPEKLELVSKTEELSQNAEISLEFTQKSVEAPSCETAQLEIKPNVNDTAESEAIEKVPISRPRVVTRKRKISERKSISESDSDNGSQFVSESVSQDPESDVEESVQRKKPRIRGKVTPRRKLPTRHSARVEEASKTVVVEQSNVKEKSEENDKKEEEESKTLQNFKFDYDENEDVAANVAAIKTLICKDTDPLKNENADASSDDDSVKIKAGRPGRKAKRGRTMVKKVEAQASSSDDEDTKSSSKMPDSKRSKTSESNEPSPKEPVKKKREKKKGLLRDLDTSLVIETIDNEAPVRASRRIAQQKIKEETDRRLMEEKLLKKMKEDAEKKKSNFSLPPDDDDEKDSDSDDSYKGESKKKRKKKMKPTDPSKPWQTSSSHSEHSESEIEEYEHHEEDPGSPLFRSDHEFSPESEDDSTPVQPIKRARTAKKQVEESSDEEDVNPNHACQVCHKTDSPEWILLCDECDCGYHCSCLKPIIFCIPSGNWFCPLCCHKKLINDLGVQLEKLDILVETIQVEEIRKQKQIEAQKLAEITEQNILNDRRKNRAGGERRRRRNDDDKESSQNEQSSENDESESNDENSSSDDSSDNAPLIYKLRKRTQATASYRFNDYDELINSAIRDDMEEVKGLGNAGRGKDISTIIEADKEEKKQQRLEKERGAGIGEKKMPSDDEKGDDGESSGSDVIGNKKSIQRKKKMRKLNALEDTSEEENSDDDFKGSPSSNSDTEEYSASSVSESSLDLPRKKGKAAQRSTRSAAKNRRYDEKFIDDHSSDDEPLIKKRNKKKSSDEEEYDIDDDGSNSTAEEVDSSDLCDDTDTESSEDNFPRKKKRAIASYDKKPRKSTKKHDEDDDKAFRAGISKKKILEKKQEENESDGSGSEKATGRRKTRGKKLLYIMEDDFESDDGIKPGVGIVRPETPPEEREMFRKKQEEIKKMLAAKNTEGAKKLAVPTIEPLSFDIEKPKSPSPPPMAESSSLSTIPKDVIQGAKALDFDYNRIKPVVITSSKASELQPEMSEEELAKMMEEEDFAQHQLKLAGEAIRKQQAILELEGKEEAFSAFSKKKDDKPLDIPPEPKKRAKKPKVEKALNEPVKAPIAEIPKMPEQLSRPLLSIPQTQPLHPNHPMSSAPPPLISNIHHQPQLHAPYSNLPQSARFGLNPNQPLPPHNLQERPSVLSSLMAGHPRPEMHPQFHRQMPPESFIQKGPPHLPPAHLQQQIQPLPSQAIVEDKEKKGRRKKFTPLRQDLPEANVPKVAKLDTPPTTSTTSVIHSNIPVVDDKIKGLPPALQRTGKSSIAVASPPQIFNPGTSPTPSVITRLIQPPPQNSPQRIGPYGFSEHDNAPSSQPPPTNRAYPSTDEIKHLAAAAASKQSRPSPQAPFNENPFVPRTMHHTLYRAPPTSQSIYGIPPHARLPYPFHLSPHPNNNLRPQDYASSPYGIPPQFAAAYYGAPPAHRPPNSNSATPLNHPENFHHPGAQLPRVVDPENPQQQATPSEFGGLVSYFSSQQELD